MDITKKKRVTIKSKNPNPLFEKWLTEWRDKAQESESKMQYIFSTALKSLRKYPLPLQTGKDCKILHGFGEKLCKMLDDKLVEYKAENSDLNVVKPTINSTDISLIPKTKQSTKRKASSPQKCQSKSDANSPEKCRSKEYVPKHRSGGFAILVALYENSLEMNNSKCMTKAEIISKGQHLCDVSFIKPGPDTRYSAWSSMRILIEKNLVIKEGKPSKFSLTSEGIDLGDKLYIRQKIEEFQKEAVSLEVDDNKKKSHNLPSSTSNSISRQASASNSSNEQIPQNIPSSTGNPISRQTSASSSSGTYFESVILPPNSFEVVLLVDNQEVNGGKSNPENEPILQELKKLNLQYEVRNLKVGDYVWICRDVNTNIELVLPYIVERKRMDDLGCSIKDDRFHEQKFRLKQCGLQNLIYLVESHGKNEHVGLPINTLLQAATNTLVQDGFSVKFTDSVKDTCQYLACVTKLVTNLFRAKTLVSCPQENLQDILVEDDLVPLMHFKELNKNSSKTRHFKVKEMFIRQLLQIKGMSLDKALAVVEKYPTPKHLRLAYKETDQAQGEKLLSCIKYGTLKKNVGQVLSQIVYQLFCKNSY